MRKLFIMAALVSVAISCNTTSKEEKIDNLNGYWEIQTAELPNGNSKEFPYSEMVDFIVLEDGEGYRKKVRPQLGGNFIASDDEEILSVKVENDSILLYYETPYTEWKEVLVSSEEDEIKLKNKQGIIYTYTRFTPYSSDYGQEKQ